MELSLWDPPNGQGCVTPFFANRSGYSTEDDWQHHFSLGYGRDMIEEDTLNEKYCVQVLRTLIEKADEDIIELEQDIVMLQCQLAWVHEDWSKSCTVVLEEEIEYLDILVHVKKEISEDVNDFSVQLEHLGELPKRLHVLVKPLLESYVLRKSKQAKSSVVQVYSSRRASGVDKKTLVARKKKVQSKKDINFLEDSKRKSKFIEPDEKKTEHRKQPFNPMAEETNTSTSIEKAGSIEMRERRENEKEVITKPNDTRHRFTHEIKVANQESRETKTKTLERVKPPDVISASQLDGVKQQITKAPTQKRKSGAVKENWTSRRLIINKRKFYEGTETLEAQATEKKDEKKTQQKSSITKKCEVEEGGPAKSSLHMKCVHKLTLADLRTIAKERNMRGYGKLRKEELKKWLGLEPPDSAK